MRLFIAVEIPKEISDKLRDLQAEFRGLAKIKFVNSFHCTLKFLGEVNENNLDNIKDRLSNINFKSFNSKIENIGVFPNDKKINIIWIGINGKIIELQKKIDENLLDISQKDQKFHGHITLGRVKFVKDKKQFIEKLKIKFEDEFLVNNFKLIKSDLTKDGPKYTTIQEYKLN